MKKDRPVVKKSAKPVAEKSVPRSRQHLERVQSLADPRSRQRVDDLITRITRTPGEATDFLHRAGIVTKKGKLHRNFGG